VKREEEEEKSKVELFRISRSTCSVTLNALESCQIDLEQYRNQTRHDREMAFESDQVFETCIPDSILSPLSEHRLSDAGLSPGI